MLASSRSWCLVVALAACDPDPVVIDRDRDGVAAADDCDDLDPFVLPGAPELCDGRDNDCNGLIDDDPFDTLLWYPDLDDDGWAGIGGAPISACDPGPGWAREPRDCLDRDPTVHPGAADGCDGIDSDCNGVIDDSPAVDRYRDEDGDGYGRSDRTTRSCGADTSEIGGDCDDDDPLVSPAAVEICNGIDDDCDGGGDDDDPEGPADPRVWFPDQDLDGVGVSGVAEIVVCDPPNAHWGLVDGDCDDLDPEVYPGALQRCDGVDNDCDGAGPDATGWWDPAWPVRVPGVLTAGADGAVDPIVTVDVDMRAALDEIGSSDAFDPATLVAVVQRCDVGAEVFSAAFTDGLARLLDPVDPTDPVGDEHGAVHLFYDGTLAPGESVPIALYLGGPPATALPGVTVDPRGWVGAAGEVAIDPDRGGLLDDLFVGGGPNRLSQADAVEGNGVATDTGWLTATGPGASTQVIEGGSLVAAISGEGDHIGPTGAFRYRTWWWGYDHDDTVYVKIHWETTAPTLVEDPTSGILGLRPFQATAPGLVGSVGTVTPFGAVGRDDGIVGAAFGWIVAPAFEGELACDADACWTAAAEVDPAAPSSVLPTGTVLVDHRVLTVVPTSGAIGDEARLPGRLDPPTLVLGVAEGP